MRNLSTSLFSIISNDRYLASSIQSSLIYTTNSKSSQIIIISEVCNLHTERKIRFFSCRSHIFQDRIKKRSQILRFISQIFHRIPIFCTRINNRKIRLLIARPKQNKQIKKLINHSVWSCRRFINFIKHDHRFESEFKTFFEHKFGLWHRTFIRIYYENHRIHHPQNSLYFASKVRMSWSIYDIDSLALVFNRGILGINGDSSLPFLIVIVHNKVLLFHFFEGSRLPQELVYKWSLSMIYMGDNCDISNCHLLFGIKNKKPESDFLVFSLKSSILKLVWV